MCAERLCGGTNLGRDPTEVYGFGPKRLKTLATFEVGSSPEARKVRKPPARVWGSPEIEFITNLGQRSALIGSYSFAPGQKKKENQEKKEKKSAEQGIGERAPRLNGG